MLKDVSPELLRQLKKLGDEYGPLGVALAAANIAGPDIVRKRLPDPEVQLYEDLMVFCQERGISPQAHDEAYAVMKKSRTGLQRHG